MDKCKLEVCVSNLKLGSQDVWLRVAEMYPDQVRLKRWGCLGWCHRCIHGPGVLMDNTNYLEAEDAQELWGLVQRYIRENWPRGGGACVDSDAGGKGDYTG